jgi:hypothetical protein
MSGGGPDLQNGNFRVDASRKLIGSRRVVPMGLVFRFLFPAESRHEDCGRSRIDVSRASLPPASFRYPIPTQRRPSVRSTVTVAPRSSMGRRQEHPDCYRCLADERRSVDGVEATGSSGTMGGGDAGGMRDRIYELMERLLTGAIIPALMHRIPSELRS